jgi:hypothetical protein
MAKETPGAKRLKEEERLKNLSGSRTFGERSKLGWHSTLFGKDKSGYGTSLSKGAASAGNKAAKEDVAKQLKLTHTKLLGKLLNLPMLPDVKQKEKLLLKSAVRLVE